MTEAEIKSIRKCYQLIAGKEDIVTLVFYNRLFHKNPELRALFPGEMTEQAKKLADVLKIVHASIDRLDSLRPTLRSMGAKHLGYGVKHQYYEKFKQALIETLQETAGTHFNSVMEEAWSTLLGQVSEEMQSGADEPTALSADAP
jgi:hemoglobin-like flavoprotein